jgi:hypothetical protein
MSNNWEAVHSINTLVSDQLCSCRSWWVPGTDHAGAILAAPGFSCIYRDQSPLFLGNQTILLAELRIRLLVCDSSFGQCVKEILNLLELLMSCMS